MRYLALQNMLLLSLILCESDVAYIYIWNIMWTYLWTFPFLFVFKYIYNCNPEVCFTQGRSYLKLLLILLLNWLGFHRLFKNWSFFYVILLYYGVTTLGICISVLIQFFMLLDYHSCARTRFSKNSWCSISFQQRSTC